MKIRRSECAANTQCKSLMSIVKGHRPQTYIILHPWLLKVAKNINLTLIWFSSNQICQIYIIFYKILELKFFIAIKVKSRGYLLIPYSLMTLLCERSELFMVKNVYLGFFDKFNLLQSSHTDEYFFFLHIVQ